MTWYTICTIIAAVIFLLYNTISVRLFGIPTSLSETFYLYKGKKDWMRILFPWMMVSMAMLLMPSWLTISEGSPWQFISFLAAASIIFVGSAPSFRDDDLTCTVHTVSAIIAAAMSIAWVCLVSQLWYIVLAWFVIVIAIGYSSRTLNRSKTYWLEFTAFMATFSSILIYEILM